MKIVVTGGTGFIGRPLVDELARLGHEVVVLSRTGRPRSSAVRQVCRNGMRVRWDPGKPSFCPRMPS